ncbi:MAG: hypothetical protein KC776_17185 [Myxococcales bacterium]|nr:hypothetical protein [Myxococcales bacterium]MCB9580255.1 hypothetical protein [Polyangiaceae bacterium]
MKRALVVLLALGAAACGGSTKQARGAESAGVIDIPSAKTQSKADDTPAPSSNAQAYTDDDDERGAVEGYDYDDEPMPAPVPMWGNPSGGATGGADCDRAADCCLKVVTVNGGDPSLAQTCDSFRMAPSATCTTLLSSFRQVAPQIGITCP